MTTPPVTITARRASRWRCGFEFTDRPRTFGAGHLTEEQLSELRSDSQLVVALGEGGAAEPAGGTAGPATTPTVQAALDTALSALRRATPDEVREFFRRMADDPEIAAKVDSEIDRQSRLIAAIPHLEEGNEAHWTKAGKPECRALEKATGFTDVSAAERDAAWEEYLKVAGKDLTGG